VARFRTRVRFPPPPPFGLCPNGRSRRSSAPGCVDPLALRANLIDSLRSSIPAASARLAFRLNAARHKLGLCPNGRSRRSSAPGCVDPLALRANLIDSLRSSIPAASARLAFRLNAARHKLGLCPNGRSRRSSAPGCVDPLALRANLIDSLRSSIPAAWLVIRRRRITRRQVPCDEGTGGFPAPTSCARRAFGSTLRFECVSLQRRSHRLKGGERLCHLHRETRGVGGGDVRYEGDHETRLSKHHQSRHLAVP
jgi:hypothetical protein